jgi:hypothetical protein
MCSRCCCWPVVVVVVIPSWRSVPFLEGVATPQPHTHTTGTGFARVSIWLPVPVPVMFTTHIHPRYHKAHYSSSCSPWWCQAYFWSHLWGDLWCLEDFFGERKSLCLVPTPSSNIIIGHSWFCHIPWACKVETVTSLNIVYALKRSGNTLYGQVFHP